jgi:outer membrane protein
MNLNMNIDILNGLKNVKQLHLANLSILANQYQLADMKENISLLVANSFLQILFNKEILKVQELQLEISEEEVQRAIELVNSGVIPKGDLYEFEANLTSVEKSVIDAKNSLKLAKIALAQLLLIDDYENFDIVDVDYKLKISNILDKSPNEIFSYAVENKNEIKIAETNLEIAKKSLEFNKSFLQPRLSAFYSISTRIAYSDRLIGSGDFNLVPVGVVENTNERVLAPVQGTKIVPPKSFSDQFDINKGQNYGLSLSIPILNGFSVRSNVNRSKINVQRSENLLFQRKLDLENTINQAYSDAYGSLKAYEASKKSLDSRKLSFEYAKEKLNIGVLNPYEYSQVKQRFESAQSDLIRSKFDLIFKLKVLEFYFGVPVNLD